MERKCWEFADNFELKIGSTLFKKDVKLVTYYTLKQKYP